MRWKIFKLFDSWVTPRFWIQFPVDILAVKYQTVVIAHTARRRFYGKITGQTVVGNSVEKGYSGYGF